MMDTVGGMNGSVTTLGPDPALIPAMGQGEDPPEQENFRARPRRGAYRSRASPPNEGS